MFPRRDWGPLMPDLKFDTYAKRFLSLEDRFMEKVFMVPESTCWFWTGYHDRDGYAMSSINDVPLAAYRMAYKLFVGELTKGMCLDHICRQRGCVNPKHMEEVTSKENTRRSPIAPAAINAQKTHCPRGHELTEGNIVTSMKGRNCLICNRVKDAERKRRYRAERKER